jgi:hypothetical protein
MTHLIIDGYNYLNRIVSGPLWGSNLEHLRRSLLDRFARYKRERPVRITVVFDAHKSAPLARQRESHKGVDVIFSGPDETADEVIMAMINSRRAGLVVVSSDRAIIDAAKERGVPFIMPGRLEEAITSGTQEGDYGADEEDRQPAKKGNPRKLPKRVRRAVKASRKV